MTPNSLSSVLFLIPNLRPVYSSICWTFLLRVSIYLFKTEPVIFPKWLFYPLLEVPQGSAPHGRPGATYWPFTLSSSHPPFAGVTKPFLIFLLHFSAKSLLHSQCSILSSGRSAHLDKYPPPSSAGLDSPSFTPSTTQKQAF